MVAPLADQTAIDRAILGRAGEAAMRWQRRSAIRKRRSKALSQGQYTKADSPERLALRLNRLTTTAARTAQRRGAPEDPELRKVMARGPLLAEELTDSIVREAIIATRDFLSIEFFERGLAAARSVGRIVVRAGGREQPLATGFLVAEGVLLTNEHVLPNIAVASQCAVQMDYEINSFGPALTVETFALEPRRLYIVDPELDFAMVAVAPKSAGGRAIAGYGWCPLVGAQGKIVINDKDCVNVVQHPAGREKEIVIRDNRVLDLETEKKAKPDDFAPFFHYEADTEKGSSGSPVFNDQWEIVALHHSGVPKMNSAGDWLAKDGSVWNRNRDPVDAIEWVGNEGVRVSSLVGALRKEVVNGEARILLDRVLAELPSPPPERGSTESISEIARVRTTSPVAPVAVDGSISFMLPVTISVQLGVPVVAGATAGGPLPAAGHDIRSVSIDVASERVTAADYDDRRGYDPGFLGFATPLPKIGPTRFGIPATLIGLPGETELRYGNYSVVMNATRRLAFISAVNIDFDAPVNLGRKEGSQTWKLDPRLDKRLQADNTYYLHNKYDKGHLTRRDDAAWGDTKGEARIANDDTFHWTNAAPQHEDLNQSDEFTQKALKLWGDLENHISRQGSQQKIRVSVFNGPVFGDNDKQFKDLLVPRAFWKIVVFAREDDTPGALGFVLEQGDLIATLPEEAIEAGDFALRQNSIEAIGSLTELDFSVIAGWDTMRTGPAREALGDVTSVPLTRLADIVF